MEKEQISIIVFVMMTLVIALPFHYKIDRLLVSSILAALVASVLFQIVGCFVVGYWDPFSLIALVTTLALSFIISIAVGLPFVYFRNKTKKMNGS
jgi:hypothetical protein